MIIQILRRSVLSEAFNKHIRSIDYQAGATPQEWFFGHVAKIDREALEVLRAGDDIQLWYGFVHVEGR